MATPAEFDFSPFDNSTVMASKNAMRIGDFSSTTAGSGIALNSSYTKALDVLTDDGGVALPATSLRAVRARVLLATAVAGVDVSVDGLFGQVKFAGVDVNSVGTISGVDGYIEMTSTASVHSTGAVCAVRGRIDMPSGAVHHGSYPLAAFGTFYDDLGGTHSTPVVLLGQGPTKAGAWDGLFSIQSASGPYATTAGSSASKYVKCYVDGTVYKIALLADS
jgi:hypothetical protein